MTVIQSLLDNPLVTVKEQARIEEVLAQPTLDSYMAREVLDYFFGRKERRVGQGH